jgi:DNA-binding NtrC family response regulator
MKILVMSPDHTDYIDINGLVAIGGKKSSGIKISGLSKSDDYGVLSPSENGLSIIPLKGKNRTPLEIRPLSKLEIEDLSFVLIPDMTKKSLSNTSSHIPDSVEKAIQEITHASDDATITSIILRHIVESTGFDRGLVIARNTQGKFEIVAHQGTDPSAPWLSESLLEETLTSKNCVIVPNIVGSRFERNQSLVGTGFITVGAWPLIWRGEVVGAIIAGSSIPQMEKDKIKSFASLFSPFIAQYVSSFVREKKLEEQIKRNRLTEDDGPFLTQSLEMKDLIGLARKIASSDLSVLIQGETGSGKEVLSKWIHEQSSTSKRPFVAVNCGAIPENLIESILFGHKRGAFTGAVADQTGKFVLAHGGSIFLDEVADLPLAVQGKLLRVLQEKTVEPVGSNKTVSVSVRVIAASHKNLKRLVEKGEFREDLYYRLAEMVLEIPPLRRRPEDALLICHQYLKDNKIDKKISTGAWEWIQLQRWPGNVRELLSCLKRAVILSQDKELLVKDFLGPHSQKSEKSWLGADNLDEAMRHFQAEKVKIALSLSDGNRKNAADLLGVNQRTLFRYLEDIREDL